MTKTAAEVEREVEASRSDLDRTVEALKEKMTPGQLFDEATHAMGGAGQQILSKFMEQAKENPMPLAVMGLGLAWLMSGSGKKDGSPGAGYREPRTFAAGGASSSGATTGIGDKVHAIGDRASDLMSDAKDQMSGAKDKIADAASSLGDTASATADKVGQYGRQAQRSFAQLLESEPLLIGAAGLLVGAAIGAALPHTDLEDRTVGPMRDKLLEKGKDLAQDGLQQAGVVAQAAYGAVKEELTKETPDGADPVDRARDVTRAAIQAGRDEISSPH